MKKKSVLFIVSAAAACLLLWGVTSKPVDGLVIKKGNLSYNTKGEVTGCQAPGTQCIFGYDPKPLN